MGTLSPPKVSVCIPVYNGGEYISFSIQSVLNQTYENFELIVCDNCSTDNTEEVVRSFKDSRIKYFRNSGNLGLVGNANRCLSIASGEYLNILHHDDMMYPDNLELKVEMLDRNPDLGLVHSNVEFIDGSGQCLNLTRFDARSHYIENGRKIFQQYILRMPMGAAFFIGAVLVRRECYLNLGGFNPLLPNVNDSEMWMRILLYYDVGCIDRRLVKYRLHETQVSKSIDDSNGLNLPGLEEHHLASQIVIEKNKERIPQWKYLKKKVNYVFSIKALDTGTKHIKNGNINDGLLFYRAALKFNPFLLAKKGFWKFLIKQAQGT